MFYFKFFNPINQIEITQWFINEFYNIIFLEEGYF